jgi:hypothetical protein
VTQQLVAAAKGMAAIEHYLIVRYFMYAQIYNHPKNLAASWVLEQAFTRARELSPNQLPIDNTMQAWLWQDGNELRLKHYLEADDGVFLYHLQRWRHYTDAVLADLCRRFLDRDLLKALEVTHLDPTQQQTLLQNVKNALEHQGIAPNYYTGLRTTFSSGYTLYQRGIKLQTERGLMEISDLSPLVKTLIQPWKRSWLIYPREIAIDMSYSAPHLD